MSELTYEYIDTILINKLKMTPKQSIGRRIFCEYKQLFKNNNITNVKFDVNNSQILFTFDLNNNHILFNISPNFPFIPPQISLNGAKYNNFLNFPSSRFQQIYEKIFNFDCMCCHSIFCRDNWNFTTSFSILLDYVKYYCSIKVLISNKIMADKIKDKYLINDINLDEWLFTPERIGFI